MGDRSRVRAMAVQSALDLLRKSWPPFPDGRG